MHIHQKGTAYDSALAYLTTIFQMQRPYIVEWYDYTNGELENMLKEVVVVYFKVLSRYLFGRTKNNHEIHQS